MSKHHPKCKWTDDLIAEAKRLYLTGLSATEVAVAMGGGFTRNSVMGKMHRLGVSRPPGMNDANRLKSALAANALSRLAAKERRQDIANQGRAVAARRNKPEPKQQLKFGVPNDGRKRKPRAIKEQVALENVEPVEMMDLKPNHCRWPIDDPRPGAWSCGAEKARGSYCGWHGAKAFYAEKVAA